MKSNDKYYMPYVYRVENQITKQFYYGSRYVETTSPDLDLFVTYFTSSKTIKQLIEIHGVHSFNKFILEIHTDRDTCYQQEQLFIKENISNPLCLNKQYRECGENIFLNKGHSDETRLKMKTANKGRIPWNKGIPTSDETRKKLSESNKGVSGSKKGVKKGPRSPDVIRKIVETRKANRALRESTTYVPNQ